MRKERYEAAIKAAKESSVPLVNARDFGFGPEMFRFCKWESDKFYTLGDEYGLTLTNNLSGESIAWATLHLTRPLGSWSESEPPAVEPIPQESQDELWKEAGMRFISEVAVQQSQPASATDIVKFLKRNYLLTRRVEGDKQGTV